MAQTLSVQLIKEGETGSPLSLKVKTVSHAFKRVAKPTGLPRVQTRANNPQPEPFAFIVDMGFMTHTITINGNCTEAEKLQIRNAALNWYRHATDFKILDPITLQLSNDRTYLGAIGIVNFEQEAKDSQTQYTYSLTFHVKTGS